MYSKIVLFLLAGVLTCNFAQSQINEVTSVEGITEYKMDNGLTVLLFPDNSSQTITVNITYMVGSRNEGYGEKGMAHLLEHMAFKGTPGHPNIPQELSTHGARPNGTTWYDRTNYFETFNATEGNLEWALDLEADRMVNSFIAKKDLESEFSVVRNEFEMGENDPSEVLMQQVANAAYLWHNYGKSTIGSRSDIERVPIDNLKAFYKKYYRPDNAVLMVTGKFDPPKTLELIQKKFGKIANPSVPLNESYTVEPAQDGEKRVNVNRVGDLQLVSALYHTPAGSDEDYSAMSIVEDVLTDAPSGRLYKALVDSQKAASVSSSFPFLKEPGFMYFEVEVPSDKNADEVEKIMKETLNGFESKPVTQEELDRAKANLLKHIDQIFRNSSYLGTYMSEFIGAGDWRLAFLQRDRIENMTLDKVNAAAQKYLIPTNRTIGRFYPTKTPVETILIPHTENLAALVGNYKGKEAMGTGEAFDVGYDAIEKRLDRGKLSNGIIYGLIEKSNRGNTVSISFSIRNGNAKSLTGKGMLPSLTAAMLNKGTKSKTRQQIEDELSRLKSSVSYSARNGNVYASVSSTEENLMPTLSLMTDMLKNPIFEPSELEKIKTAMLASIENNKTDPQYIASYRLRVINNRFPEGHPLYTMTLEEQTNAIKATTIQDIRSFYNEFYGLGKSILVGIGNLKSDEVKSFMEDNFKEFQSKEPYQRLADPYAPNKDVHEDILTPDKQNAFTLGTLGVQLSQDSPDYPALNMASTILGGGFLNSRFADRLRQKDGVSYGVGSQLNADSETEDKNSTLFLYAIYNPDNYDKVQTDFTEELDKFIKDGITEEELKNAVNGWIQEESVSRAKDNELASTINNNLFYDRTMDFQKSLEERTKQLTVDDVNKAIKKYIKPYKEWTVVNAGDYKK